VATAAAAGIFASQLLAILVVVHAIECAKLAGLDEGADSALAAVTQIFQQLIQPGGAARAGQFLSIADLAPLPEERLIMLLLDAGART
jgi:hypothetical protein